MPLEKNCEIKNIILFEQLELLENKLFLIERKL